MALQCLPEEGDALRRRIHARRREDLKRRDVVAAETGVDALDEQEAAHEQSRTDGEHHGGGHFHDYKRGAHASARGRATFPQDVRPRRPRELQCGREAGHNRCDEGYPTRDDRGAGVDRNVIDARDIERPEPGDYIERPACECEASGSAQRRQDQAFGEHLSDQARAAGAERLSHGELARPADTARQQQVRDVCAGDDEEERRRAKKKRQHVAEAPNQVLAQRHHLRRDVLVGLRILARQLRRDSVELRSRVRKRDTRPQPPEHIPEPRATQGWLELFESRLGQPHGWLRPRGAIVEEPQFEIRPQHADEGIRVGVVHAHATADDGGVAAEGVPPQGIAEDGHAFAAPLIFVRQKRPAVEHRRVEDGEELLADPRGFQCDRFAASDSRLDRPRLGNGEGLERLNPLHPVDGVGRCDVLLRGAGGAVVLPDGHDSFGLPDR
jgi:hypothetical protein